MNFDRLKLRESQTAAITDEERENGDESNPILFAESGPNRFHILTLFFPDEDGVRIENDLDLNEITVYYFDDEDERELTDGPLYQWAMAQYEDNR